MLPLSITSPLETSPEVCFLLYFAEPFKHHDSSTERPDAWDGTWHTVGAPYLLGCTMGHGIAVSPKTC
jgi:hypothetical protein